MTEKKRSSADIRESLAESRRRLEADLAELEERVETTFSPKSLVVRHPVLVGVAGALVGVLIIRKPALVARSVTRLAQLGAPLLVKALLQRQASAGADLPRPDADDRELD